MTCNQTSRARGEKRTEVYEIQNHNLSLTNYRQSFIFVNLYAYL